MSGLIKVCIQTVGKKKNSAVFYEKYVTTGQYWIVYERELKSHIDV